MYNDKVQKDKFILSILSETMSGSKNIRRIEVVVKGQLYTEKTKTPDGIISYLSSCTNNLACFNNGRCSDRKCRYIFNDFSSN